MKKEKKNLAEDTKYYDWYLQLPCLVKNPFSAILKNTEAVSGSGPRNRKRVTRTEKHFGKVVVVKQLANML